MAGLQGRSFGGFQLVEQLSGGGLAEIYRGAPARPGGREVVVKVIHPEFVRQPGFQQQFQSIVQNAGRVGSHPHILPLIASGEESGYLYLITPYVAAGTLRDRIQQGSRLGTADVGPFFRQVCDALGYAHSLGVVHGNVKPSNIFLFEGRHVLLGDFGRLWNIALMDMEHGGSGTDAVDYLAPEVASGQTTQQSDVYSVGAVLYAALVGHAPFQAAKLSEVFAAHARQPAPHLAQATPAVAPPLLVLDGVIQRAMAKRPDDRYPSAMAVAQAVETTIQKAPGMPAPMAPAAGLGLGAGPFGVPGMPALAPGAPVPAGNLGPPAMQPAFPVVGVAPGALAVQGLPAVSTLGQLNPPFPPLPASATVEPQMEHGRPLGTIGSDSLRPSVEQVAAAGDIPLQPTLRMLAPQSAAGPGTESDNAAESPWSGLLEDESESPPLPKMPAIRRPGVAPSGLRASGGPRSRASGGPQGFTVAGGSGPVDPLGSEPLPAPGSEIGGANSFPGTEDWPGQQWNEAGGRDLFGDVGQREPGADWLEQYSGAMQGPPVAGSQLEDGAHGSPPPDGLPRLTSPAMRGMPPSWQEIVSGNYPAYEGGSGNGVPNGQYNDGSAPLMPWKSDSGQTADDWQAEANGAWPSGEADAWGRSLPGSRPLPAVPGARTASRDAYDLRGGARSSVAEMPEFARQPDMSPRRRETEDPDDYQAFDDDRVWTQGLTAVRRNRRRWVRRLALVMALVLLVDFATLVVARPDLCPSAGCRDLHSTLVQRFPVLQHFDVAPAPGLTANPSALNLTVVTGKSVSTPITVSNAGPGPLTWHVASTLSWLTVDHINGTLGAGASVKLTVTAKSTGVKAGTYSAGITLTAGQTAITIPATIVVNKAG
jgi:hypothetical protein